MDREDHDARSTEPDPPDAGVAGGREPPDAGAAGGREPPALLAATRAARPDVPVAHADTLLSLVGSAPPSSGAAAVAAPEVGSGRDLYRQGATIKHFIVVGKIGEGGMGVVLAAYDPLLDRKVAIKLLRPQAFTKEAAQKAQARLLREAKAMAKLSHPNVIAVFEAGTVGDQVYLAMEFIEGETLRAWVARADRTWREVLAAYVKAGLGLAAAHQAGLVHRDFKADNVLVDRQGRVRVTDLGLATNGEPATEPRAPSPAADRSAAAPCDRAPAGLDRALTRTGEAVGTPVYMAPEQHRGEAADGRTDQFGFCASLYESLYGAVPFAGDTYPQLRESVLAGTISEPPPGREVPRWLHEVLRRGLSSERDARFGSMDALLDELTRDRGRPRRAALAGVAVVAALALAALGAVVASRGARPCAGAEELARELWSDPARARVRQAFQATGRPHAEDTFARVNAVFDRYRADWAAMHAEACVATKVRGVQSARLFDLRMACLGRRSSELSALVNVMTTELKAAQLDQAVQAAYGLTPIASCADREALEAAVALPREPQVRQRVAEARRQLDRASALRATGKYQEGLALAERVAAEARTIDYHPLRGEALLQLGSLQQRTGAPKVAEGTLLAALQAAGAGKAPALVARILSELVWVVGYQQARYQEGHAFYQAGTAAAALGERDVLLQVQLLKNAGVLQFEQGKYEDALRSYERALHLLETTVGTSHPHVATALSNVGTAHAALGCHEDALKYYQRALAVGTEAQGSDHPYVMDYLANIASALADQNKIDEGRQYLLRALAAMERRLGKDHPDLGYPLFNLGNGYMEQGRCDEAVKYFTRALAIREAALGATHPFVAYPLGGLGRCQLQLGRTDEAVALLERAVRILEAAATDPNPLAEARFSLAKALWQSGKRRAHALELALAARATWAKTKGRWQEELTEVEKWLRERGR